MMNKSGNTLTRQNPIPRWGIGIKVLTFIYIGLTHIVIASLRRRRGNPVFPAAALLDCFAALAMTKGVRKS
jgi:hypothetical protein